jgi:5-formyltetrahydrofolate cyclo-ligase
MTIPDEITQWRKARRKDLLARRITATKTHYEHENVLITRSLVNCFPILQWMVVGFYWPYQGEFDPRFAIHYFRKKGGRTALPVVTQKGAPLQFREWWPGVRTTQGAFDLPVPQETKELRPEALLIPPVGFDTQGYRLGYGGGYFDRTLAGMSPQPLKIGVGFELSRIPTIHPQPHDVPMDFVVTEEGVHHVGEDGLELVHDPCRILALTGALIRKRHLPAPGAIASVDGQFRGSVCPVTRTDASPLRYA